MKKVFQQTTTFIRFLESLWRCSGNKSIWRRFFVLVAILTVSAFAFQTLVHTYLVIPDRPFGSDHRNDYSFFQSSSSSLQSGESLKGGTPQKVHLTRTNSFISPDESNKLMESFSVEQENTKLEARVQKKTSGTANKKDRNLADVTKGAMSLSPQRHVPPKQKHIWLLPPNEALVLAKREIDHAPSVNEDPDLYAPIFRNISVFKRSYELMEMTLKVYIYRDGSRPIFHKPPLKGIYASEGWFMKLMEENKQFVTRDPEKAHLFYLPYSARQMGLTLYVAGSHDLKPLSNFLRDYVNMIAEEVEAFALMADDLKLVASQFRRLSSKQLQHAFRFYSSQWKTWAACFIQAAWRRYWKKKAERSLHVEEDKLQEALTNDDGATLSLGATIYASRFAANALRNLRENNRQNRMQQRLLPLLPPKPAEPDFTSLKH